MFIYSYEAKLKERLKKNDWGGAPEILEEWSQLSSEAKVNSKKGKKIFIKKALRDRITICAVVDSLNGDNFAPVELFNRYISQVGIECSLQSVREETVSYLIEALSSANKEDFIDDDDEYLFEFNIKNIDEEYFRFKENSREYIQEKLYAKTNALKKAKKLMCKKAILPEIERIFCKVSADGFMGHPVHYSIVSDSMKRRREITELLIGMLCKRGRLVNKRYSVIQTLHNNRWSHEAKTIDEIFTAQGGGAVVIDIGAVRDIAESDIRNSDLEELKILLQFARKHRRNTLTIVEVCRKSTRLYTSILEEMHGMAVIRIDEDIVMTRQAKQYLRWRAEELGIKDPVGLLEKLPKSNDGYLANDLDKVFDDWYDNYLRNIVHSQYSDAKITQLEKGKKPVGDSYRELKSLIGLENIKTVIDQAIDFHKMQKLMKSMEIVSKRPSMHMVFAGNPGTAKTTVARLMARIMKDNGLLSVGNLIEVGRADLVGKYLGWTATIVKQKFEEAKGSVLFIDEAYSLLEDKEGLYGDEAINTIVQEMENSKDDTVVVFAGYPNEMENFIERNPGLKSRITFKVDFPDYNTSELVKIFKLMLKRYERTATDEAIKKVERILNKASKEDNYGNGRFIRNLLEKAILSQSTRLMKMKYDDIDREVAKTLKAEDFDYVMTLKRDCFIGFS